jgi:hypothetical protein
MYYYYYHMLLSFLTIQKVFTKLFNSLYVNKLLGYLFIMFIDRTFPLTSRIVSIVYKN